MMPAKEKSKEIQSSADCVYRFGEFELRPAERMLTNRGEPVTLPPKSFDALHHLVCRAERLVTKRELMDALWPATFVTEANLTNAIVSLRKVLGRDAIRTVSGHGYRFTLPVSGNPQVDARIAERFGRVRDLTMQRSLDSAREARELCWTCVAEDPGFAPGWAWLGRISYFLSKIGGSKLADLELARAALQRALLIDPDLACAHQFLTPMETDTGQARRALERLLARAQAFPDEAETWAGLVQVLRYCGLPDESLLADERCSRMDSTVVTSVPHTLFLLARYPEALEKYSRRSGGYMDSAAWAAMGQTERAVQRLRELTAGNSFSPMIRALLESLLDALEGRFEEAARRMTPEVVAGDSEAMVYLARHFGFMGAAGEAIAMLRRAREAGFVCAPCTLQVDPWFASVRAHPEFPRLMVEARRAVRENAEVVRRFRLAGLGRLLRVEAAG